MDWKTIFFLFLVSIIDVNARLVNNQRKTNQVVRLSDDEMAGKSRRETQSIKCQDEDGHTVDWFVAYKIAKIKKSTDSDVRQGLGYSFLQPGLKQWKLSTRNINESDSVVGKTIDILFSKGLDSDDFVYLTYNDQPPNAPTIDNNGHTKGVLIGDETNAIWLQHSVPHFPLLNSSSYSYPSTGYHNGQIFFCLTLTRQQLDVTIGDILKITKPHIFKFNFPSRFNTLYSNLRQVLPHPKKKIRDKKRKHSYKNNGNIFNLPVGQLNLTIFAKSPKLEVEIYSDVISPSLNTDLKVQSWLNGPHALPSNCSSKTLSVLNVLTKTIDGNEFLSTSDHSKWGVGGSTKYTCITDLNRMDHQKLRGGAALCTQYEDIWTNFQRSIISLLPCP